MPPEAETATQEAIEPTTAETAKPLAKGLQTLFDKQFLRAGTEEVTPTEDGSKDDDADPHAQQTDTGEEDTTHEQTTKRRVASTAARPEPTKATDRTEATKPTSDGPTFEQLVPDFTTTTEEPPAGPVEGSKVAELMPEEPPSYIRSEKHKEDYRKWRANQIALERDLHQVRSQQKAAPSAEAQAENERLTKENADLLERVERIDLYSSPRFQAEHVQPRDKVFVDAMNLVKQNGGNPEALRKAMGMKPGRERQDAIDEIADSIESKMQRDKLGRMVDDMDRRTDTITELLTKARETAAEQRKRETIERHQNGEKSAAELRQLLASKIKDFEAVDDYEFAKRSARPEHSWWNEDIDNANQAAEHLLMSADYGEIVTGAYLAGHALRYLKGYRSERARRIAVEADNAALRGAGGDHGKDRGKAPKTPKAGESFETGVLTHLRGS